MFFQLIIVVSKSYQIDYNKICVKFVVKFWIESNINKTFDKAKSLRIKFLTDSRRLTKTDDSKNKTKT